MKKTVIASILSTLLIPTMVFAASPIASVTKEWTYSHALTGVSGLTSEIAAYDTITNTIWVAGVVGVDVLNATNGSLLQHINFNTSALGFTGSINSVAIKNGVAAFAIENSTRTNPGAVQLYDTSTRSLLSGVNTIAVGALPDMLTFTNDGSKLLVANEGTPTTYGARIGSTIPRNYGPAAVDPVGSVSIINMSTRTVAATPTFAGVPQVGNNIRTNTGMDFEPEYIAVNAAGTKAYVTLQEANAIGVLDLNTNSFDKVMGLGVKDFSLPGNQIDTRDNTTTANPNGTILFTSPNVKGLYMPDGIAAYEVNGNTYWVTANEGDFREDDGDRSNASTLGATGDLADFRISNTDSSPGNLFARGTRDFTIRDVNGSIVFSSGDQLDKKAAELGIYDDVRSRVAGVEPEGVELLTIAGRTIAAIGLERTKKGAVALYDITDPANSTFLDMLVTDGDIAPEGLKAFEFGGKSYLAIANEVSNTTTLYSLAPVPEPESYAMLLAGLSLIAYSTRRRKQ